jgi:urease accessory protein
MRAAWVSSDLSSLHAFLSALQLADASFPTGLYTQSHGLESFVQRGVVTDRAALAALLETYLVHQIGPADGVALSCAHAAAGDLRSVARIDQRLSATKLIRESREASRKTGQRVLALAADIFGSSRLVAYRDIATADPGLGNYAVVLGLVTGAVGVGRQEAMAIELYSFATGFLGAGMRLSVVNHEEVQAVLHAIKPLITRVVEENWEKGYQEISTSLPEADIMGMIHERAVVRLFVS